LNIQLLRSKAMTARTPRGFRDILPIEAALREHVSTRCQQVFSLWGYEPVETPALELLSGLEAVGYQGNTAFKLFDADGELLVMRPDVTLPIARLVGGRLELPSDKTALRLRYLQPVYREERALRAEARAITQAGVECIGTEGAAVDAEVLIMMAEALDAAGVSDYTIALCTVSVLRALLAACIHSGQVEESFEQSVLTAWHKSDLVGVEELMKDSSIDPILGQSISALARLRGTVDAIAQCRQMLEQLTTRATSALQLADLDRATKGLHLLDQTLTLISQIKAHTDWLVDFSVMSSFDYYTGMICAAYAPGSGYPLASGGRYDGTLAQFGKSAPAAGFALNLERVIDTLLTQGVDGEAMQADNKPLNIDFDAIDTVSAFRKAQELREGGQRVVLRAK
jgi:ATP phosphoribosyltransferase regulatory subunit